MQIGRYPSFKPLSKVLSQRENQKALVVADVVRRPAGRDKRIWIYGQPFEVGGLFHSGATAVRVSVLISPVLSGNPQVRSSLSRKGLLALAGVLRAPRDQRIQAAVDRKMKQLRARLASGRGAVHE